MKSIKKLARDLKENEIFIYCGQEWKAIYKDEIRRKMIMLSNEPLDKSVTKVDFNKYVYINVTCM